MYFLLTILFLVAPVTAGAQYSGEHIASFESNIAAYADGSFEVREQIKYVFADERHGIFRFIPREHPDKPSHPLFTERYIDIDSIDVRMDGEPVPHTVDESRGRVTIQIGDPDVVISGAHLYEITYRVHGGLSYMPSGGADLYWNVTGGLWEVPIQQVTARLASPDNALLSERSCYRDVRDVTGSCARVWDDGGVTVYEVSGLMPGEEMTIAQAVNRTKVETVRLERMNARILWPLGILFWFGVLGLFVYRYRNTHKTGRPIIAQYEPYPEVKPMYTGLLIDGRLDARDITACIVYLAEQGYIKITKSERTATFFFAVSDYELALCSIPDASISQFEREILLLIFGEPLTTGSVVSLNDLRSLSATASAAKRAILNALKNDLEVDLERQGFFQKTEIRGMILFVGCLIACICVYAIGSLFALSTLTVYVAGACVVGTGLILSLAQRRRTPKGFEALDHLKGFKLFLETTEKDRYEFHNAPEKSPAQFMEYLPYAVAFGVEERWAELFHDVTIPNPSWYDGGVNAAAFSAIDLTQSVSAFSTAFAVSTGTHGSASSGGGFAGGGVGGGGGGSW